MAKKSMIQRNVRRQKMVSRYSEKRSELKKEIMRKDIDMMERMEKQNILASLPLDSSRVRLRGICHFTGRSRGYIRKFGLSRIKFREMASSGLLPGVMKHGH